MKFAHILSLIIFGFVYLFSRDLAKSVDVGATVGFWISIVVTAIMLIIPLLITGGGAIAGGSAGGIFGGILGGLGGGLFSLVFFVVPIAFVLLSCFGYYFLDQWGKSGLEDQSAGIIGAVLLCISFLIVLLLSGSSN